MLKARKAIITRGAGGPITCQRDGNGARCGSVGHEITIATAHQAVIAKATVKRIGAITAKQCIGRSITKQAIGARAADHMFKARQAIIARRAACPIGHQIDGDGATACGIGQNIVMRVTNKRIITKAAIQGICAIIAIQRIIAACASQRIGRSIAQQAICPRAADYMFEAGQAIIARTAACPIGRQVHRNRTKHGSVG